MKFIVLNLDLHLVFFSPTTEDFGMSVNFNIHDCNKEPRLEKFTNKKRGQNKDKDAPVKHAETC